MRYHGGKWILGKWLISHFPAHRVYVEPFGGAASALMQKPRSYAEVYNDLDGEVVNLFQVLRSPTLAAELVRAVELTPFSRQEFELSYEPCAEPVEQARRTLFRAQAGHGTTLTGTQKTGFRSNVTRPRTTPAHDWRSYPAIIPQITERLRGVVIEHDSALRVIERYDSTETLFYIDPPYTQGTRGSSANRAYRHEMGDEEHKALADALHSVKGMVVLSGYQSSLYDAFFPNWVKLSKETFADGSRKRTETVWLNPQAVGLQMTLF
jgi:DNA adenine methylase